MDSLESVKDESFVISEFVRLIEESGPVCYISSLCGKFIQRNGISVTSIVGGRPLDIFKRNLDIFTIVGGGNVTLKAYADREDVKRLVTPAPVARKNLKASVSDGSDGGDQFLWSKFPPEEEEVAMVFYKLIEEEGTETVYISALCGRFLQRCKIPVTSLITCRPADLLRKYPDVFVMTGGGHVGLREVLGPDAVSVPARPPRGGAIRQPGMDSQSPERIMTPDAAAGDNGMSGGVSTDYLLTLHSQIASRDFYKSVVQMVKDICGMIQEESFLRISNVRLGGAVGKGLVALGSANAVICLELEKLPLVNHRKWLPAILDTLKTTYSIQLKSKGCCNFKIDLLSTHLSFTYSPPSPPDPPLPAVSDLTTTATTTTTACTNLDVDMYVTGRYESEAQMEQCIDAAVLADRIFYQPAFTTERTNFIGRQVSVTKTAIRLLHWWCSKQAWSNEASVPPKYVVELLAVYAYHRWSLKVPDFQSGNEALVEILSGTFRLFSMLSTLSLTWVETGLVSWQISKISPPLLKQLPLLVDPVCPFFNLVDPNYFDCRELMTKASIISPSIADEFFTLSLPSDYSPLAPIMETTLDG